MIWIGQYIGYLATLLLALSLLVNNDLRFRWLNTLGCVSFIVYGLMINALPVIFTNTLLFVINTYYLVRIYNRKEDFDLLAFNWSDPIIQKFFSYHRNDLEHYFPGFEVNENSEVKFIVLRDMSIANVFAARLTGNGRAIVEINYTIPKYRDYKVGTFIFQKEKGRLIEKGVRELLYEKVTNKGHAEFLRRMGFTKNSTGFFVKVLDENI